VQDNRIRQIDEDDVRFEEIESNKHTLKMTQEKI
jgi:hypothetical protein